MQQPPSEEEKRQKPQEGAGAGSPDGSKKRSGDGPGMMAMGGAAMEFGASIVGLALLGWWLDGKFSTGPWLLLSGLAVGLLGGVYNLYRLGKRYF